MNRIKEFRVRAGLSMEALATRVNTTAPTINKLEKGHRRLNTEWMDRLAVALGCKPADLIAEASPSHREPSTSSLAEERCVQGYDYATILIPSYDLALSAGPGTWCETDPVPMWSEPFDPRWLRRITASPAGNLFLVSVSGDSMEPTLHDGDHILIDRTENAIRRDGVYAMRFHDHLLVKRVTIDVRSGRVTISSDNSRYDSYRDVDGGELNIVGRIIWVGRKL
ncbi:MAG: helix-turn-helix transcriptional regulator [Alphaproteobacteria bacterium]|nr:helix-turn-helix transcriptional regulator [Alphaproteobacteria bacterium]